MHRSVLSMDVAPGGELGVSGGSDSTVRVWHTKDGLMRVLNHHDCRAWSYSCRPHPTNPVSPPRRSATCKGMSGRSTWSSGSPRARSFSPAPRTSGSRHAPTLLPISPGAARQVAERELTCVALPADLGRDDGTLRDHSSGTLWRRHGCCHDRPRQKPHL